MTRELYGRALTAIRRSSAVWTGVLALLAASVVSLWPSMSESGSLDSMMDGLSPELALAFGLEDYGSAVGFLNGNLYAVFLPLLLSAMAIMQMSALTAGDEDAGRFELLMALPVSRVQVYATRLAAVATSLAVASLAVGVIVGAGGAMVGMDVNVLAVTVQLYLFALFHAGIAFALAGVGWASSTVIGVSFAVLGIGYVIHALFPLAGWNATYSPWHWALGNEPLTSGFSPGGISIFLILIAALAGCGLVMINRRTIRTV